MLFNSYIFILIFLPLALVLYFGCNRLGKEKLAMALLIGMSLWFYAYFQLSYIFILLGSVLFNFCLSRLLCKGVTRGLRKGLLAVGILADVAVIFIYKYCDFFVENLNAVFGTSLPLLKLVMPLGISFFTFQQISYLVDSYGGEKREITAFWSIRSLWYSFHS